MSDIESGFISKDSNMESLTTISSLNNSPNNNSKASFKFVLYWLWMTMGIGVLTLPHYVSQLGLLGGCLAIFVAGVLSYIKFIFIFSTSEEH